MTSTQRPNVLFLLTDDQRHDTIGALGNPHIQTPNIDRLVHRGTAFPRHFCTTPICQPARAEILTGCNSFTNEVPWFNIPIKPGLTLLSEAFQSAGYHTIHVGKWHNEGHPKDRGYDRTHTVFGVPGTNLNDASKHGHYVRFKEPHGEVAGHSSEVFVDAALRALENAPDDNPWFCYLAFFAPHDPHDSPAPFDTMYDPADMPLLPNYMPEHPFDNGDMTIRDEQLDNWPRTQDAMRRYRARYYGLISHLDSQIGRLIGALEVKGELDNTIIVFTGDQGLGIGSHGLLGKENMYDHSIASPLILSGPGIPKGGRCTALSHHTDLFPTLCELTGVARPETATDGHSLMPIVQGKERSVRDAILCEFYSPEEPGQPMRHTQRCIRTEKWKLTWYPLINRFQLFDLQRDPVELVDLLVPWRIRRRQAEAGEGRGWQKNLWAAPDLKPHYGAEEIEAVTQTLYARMLELMEEQGDPMAGAAKKQVPPGCEK